MSLKTLVLCVCFVHHPPIYPSAHPICLSTRLLSVCPHTPPICPSGCTHLPTHMWPPSPHPPTFCPSTNSIYLSIHLTTHPPTGPATHPRTSPRPDHPSMHPWPHPLRWLTL